MDMTTSTNSESYPGRSLVLEGVSGPLAAIGFGEPDNPPILALHGWLDNAASFGPLAARITDHYVVALDFAGHGDSAHRPPGCKYHMVDYVADVAHAVAALGWSRFDLIGHSLGAGVSLVYAAIFTEQVGRLVMIDGLGPITDSPANASERLRNSIVADLDARRRDSGLNSTPASRVYPDWQKLINARRRASPISEKGAALLLERGARRTESGYVVKADTRLKHPSALYLSEDVVLQFISEINCPALLILANQGLVKSRHFIPGRIEAFANLTVRSLEGGHHLHLDQPTPVAREIMQFISQHDG